MRTNIHSSTSVAAIFALIAACATTPEGPLPSSVEGSVSTPLSAFAQAEESGGSGGSSVAEIPSFPRWRVYRLDVDTPYDSPWHVGQQIAIREGDENNPAKWVRLSLGRHWIAGDRYFDELMQESRIDATDLLMITSDILEHHGRLPRLSAPMGFLAFEGEGSPEVSVEFPYAIPPPPRRHPAPDRRHGKPPAPQTPQQRASYDAYVAAVKNGVRPEDPPPKPFPGDAGYTPNPGEHQETFRCEGGVFHGYKRACTDWQRMRDGEKWAKKLSAWSAHHFDPANVTMSQQDWATLCQVATTVVGLTGCLSAVASCGTAEAMTFGTLTIPCFWIVSVICNGHAAAGTILTGRCDKLMGRR